MRRNGGKNWEKRRSRDRRGREKPVRKTGHEVSNERSARVVPPPSREVKRLLEGIVRNPAQALSALPLLSEAEQQQLLVQWNQTSLPGPAPLTIS